MLKIGISRAVPRGHPAGYRRIRSLEPGPWFNSVTPEEYRSRFLALLAGLDARSIVPQIETLADGRDAALLCFENPHDPAAWCHRGQVSEWLKAELDFDVFEFGLEA